MKIRNIAKKTSNVVLHTVAGAASAAISAVASESVYTDISLKMKPLHVTHKGFGPWKRTIISRPGAKSLYPINPSTAKVVTASAAAVGAVSGGVYGAQLDKALTIMSSVDIRPTVDIYDFEDDDEDDDEDKADSTNTTSPSSDTSESSSDSKSKWIYDKATKSFVNKSAK